MASIPDPPTQQGGPGGSSQGQEYDVGPAIREGWGGIIRDGRYRRSGRRVTVEDIRPDLIQQPGLIDRLGQIGRDAASLRDPHLLAVFDLVDDRGGYRLVAEWSDAPSLQQRLRADRLSPEQAAGILSDVLAGLSALHAAALFHGQVGPDTVVVESGGRARLAELAVCAAAATPEAGCASDVRDAARLGLLVLRGTGSRLDPMRRRLDAAVATEVVDAAGLRTEIEAIAAAALGTGWKDRRSAVAAPAPGRRRQRRLVVLVVALLMLVAAGVVGGVALLGNRRADIPRKQPLAIGNNPTLTVTPASAGCDTTLVFVGRGSLSGTGTLVYRWEQSDGEATADTSLPIQASDGAFQLTQAWRLEGSQTVNGSMTLHILRPIDRSIRRTFHYLCP